MPRFLRTFAPLVLLAAASLPVQAVVFTNTNTSTGPSVFSGVADVFISGLGNCSGTLLSTGMHILTAGHCAVGAAAGNFSIGFRFDNGAGVEQIQTLGVTSVILNPFWNLSLTSIDNILAGVDLAVLTLNAVADSRITRYDIDRSAGANLTGSASTVVGFGQSGVGGNGGGSGVRRAGDNTIVNTWSNGSGVCQAGFNLLDPSFAPLCTVLPTSSPSNVGISAFGDSGGALFVNGKIAGVNSFVKCGPGVTNCSPSNPNAITLGSEAGAARVSASSLFIDTALGIPEPSTVVTLGAGLLGLAFVGRRQRRKK